LSPDLDSAFNLTCTYRRDSEFVRKSGNIRRTLLSRFQDETGKLKIGNDEYLEEIINAKSNNLGNYNTGWIVSNCDRTAGARKRWEFAQVIIFSAFGNLF